MKRLICFLSILLVFPTLWGCNSTSIDPVSFFYCREPDQIQYFNEAGVICAESRDLTGHRGDLQYMIRLYLAGPLEEGLRCPFPSNTRLLETKKIVSSVRIKLSDMEDSLSDAEFSLACACLTQTCISFSQCTEVIITSGDRSITMNAENLVLSDVPMSSETNLGG